jgi:hypothetical protein
MNVQSPTPLLEDPLWYKDAIIYQLHLKSIILPSWA